MTIEWLPDAVRDVHGSHPFPWAETTDPKGCLHTTETVGKPGYDGWTIMPHASVLPIPGKGVTVYQHLPFSQGSFALRHTRSQPTNGDYVFQFELIGTCDPSRHDGAYRWFEADDAVLLDLYLKVIRPLDQSFTIPFRGLPFLRYPDQAGSNRLTDAQFDTYRGWLGHQHVPQNDHGDPGAFPWVRLTAVAARYEESKEDHDMTPEQITQAVLGARFKEYVDQDGDGVREARTVADILFSSHASAVGADRKAAQAIDAVAALSLKVDRLTSLIEALPKPGA